MSSNQNKNIILPLEVNPASICTYSVDLTTSLSSKLSLVKYNLAGNLTTVATASNANPKSMTFTSANTDSGKIIVNINYAAGLT